MARTPKTKAGKSGRRTPATPTPTGKSKAPKIPELDEPRTGQPPGSRAHRPMRGTPSVGKQVGGIGPDLD